MSCRDLIACVSLPLTLLLQALLYIVPAVTFALFGRAAVLGDLAAVLAWEEVAAPPDKPALPGGAAASPSAGDAAPLPSPTAPDSADAGEGKEAAANHSGSDKESADGWVRVQEGAKKDK